MVMLEQVVVPPIRSKLDLRSIRAHRGAVAALRPDVFQAALTNIWGCQWALLAAAWLAWLAWGSTCCSSCGARWGRAFHGLCVRCVVDRRMQP